VCVLCVRLCVCVHLLVCEYEYVCESMCLCVYVCVGAHAHACLYEIHWTAKHSGRSIYIPGVFVRAFVVGAHALARTQLHRRTMHTHSHINADQEGGKHASGGRAQSTGRRS